MSEIINTLDTYLHPYISEIATLFLVGLIVLLGNEMNRWLRWWLRYQSCILRFWVLMMMNSVVYGTALLRLNPLFTDTLKQLEATTRGLTLLIIAILIGLWAQRRRKIS